MSQPSLLHFADVASGDTRSFFDDDFTLLGGDIKTRCLTTQTTSDQLEVVSFFGDLEGVVVEEQFQNFLGRKLERPQ